MAGRKLSKDIVSKIAPQIAGYRLPAAVILSKSDAQATDHPGINSIELANLQRRAIKAHSLIKQWLNTGLHWYAHPVTKTPEFILKLKSLNRACEDLLCFLYTKTTLENMTKLRSIYRFPVPNFRARNWIMWNESTFKFPDDPIFK